MSAFNPNWRTGVIKRTRAFVHWMIVAVLVTSLVGGLLLKNSPVDADAPANFATHNDFATGAGPESVAVGDFNGDGKLDLATADISSGRVSILLGTGTGSFGPKTDFPTGNVPRSVAVGDFNRDGKLDLAVANQNGNSVSILLGTGTGSFAPKTDFPTGINPSSVAVGDFNGDGKLDLAITNQTDNTVSILIGTGTGSFGAKTDFATGNLPVSVAVSDFNGDGKLDLAIANATANTVSILLGTGTGSFGTKTDFTTGSSPRSLAVGDFNGDGKLDLATANANDSTVSILLGTGTGSFGAKTDFPAGGQAFSVAIGDFNGDGKLDLATANGNANTVSVLLGTGTGSFGSKTDFPTGNGAMSVAVGEFNGDGRPDLVTASGTGTNSVSILLNTSKTRPLSPLSFAPHSDFATGNQPNSVAVGDFNRDGKQDLVTTNTTDDKVSILLGNGNGTFGVKNDFSTGHGPFSVAVGDFNGDGKLDLVTADLTLNKVSILLGNGDGTFGTNTDFPTGVRPLSVAVGDFNGDGKLDLVTANFDDNTVSILLGNGDGTFGTNVDFATGNGPFWVAVGDFNGDGKPDLAVSNNNVQSVSVLLGHGDGTFGTHNDLPAGYLTFLVAVGDFNGDGKLDLVTSNANNTFSILLGHGDGTFQTHADFPNQPGTTIGAVGDFNGDGKLDLAAIGDGNVSIILGQGDGTFPTNTTFSTAAGVGVAAVGDFNRDGKLDLATTNAGGDIVSILPNSSLGPATNLAITQINGGADPVANVPFSVVVQSQDGSGTPSNVLTSTTVSLSLNTGTGTLGGTLTGTIAAGNHSVTISGVTYSKAESGVIITATSTSGDSLVAGNSVAFTVDAPTTVFTDPGGTCSGHTPCFTTIQAGINAVASGGTVNIGAGGYGLDVNFNATATYNINGDIDAHNVTITSGTVMAGGAKVSIFGDWTNNGGTFNGGTSTINFFGSAGTIGGSQSTTFTNLMISAPGIKNLAQNETVNGVLTLDSDLNTNSFTLTMTNSASSAGTGDVIGTVDRAGFVSGGPALSFGSQFNTIQIDSGTAPTDILIRLTETVPTDASTGQTNSGFPNAVARTYVISPNGGSGISATLQLHYNVGDLNGNSEASLNLFRFDSASGIWQNQGSSVFTPGGTTTRDDARHAVTQSGITNFSPWTLASVVPTAVNFDKFTATAKGAGTLLEWQTGFEVNNLGFNIYRQVGGERVRINPSLIAGSALMVGSNVTVEAGNGYSWQDDSADSNASYWLEDVDLNGNSTWHGPYGVTSPVRASRSKARSALLSELNESIGGKNPAVVLREYPAGLTTTSASFGLVTSVTKGRTPTRPSPISSTLTKQWSLASQSALKIAINKSGWYHLNMVDLMAAGLSSNAHPSTLQMFVGGTEIPIQVNSKNQGTLSADDSIEFYGSAIDTPTSNTQIYWLVAGSQSGKRISTVQSPGSTNNVGPTSFLYTVERKDRSLYFSSLLNGDTENWFGPVINTNPVTEALTVNHLDKNSSEQATVEIALQGVTTNSHQVNVMLNGSAIESISFEGMTHKTVNLSIQQSSLAEGNNQITLAAQGSGDVSLVDYVRITYAHSYAADSNTLFSSVGGMQPVEISGFTSNQIRAIDVANPNQPIEVEGTIAGDNGNYSISIGPAKMRNLLAFTPDQMLQPMSITANQPSALNKGGTANYLVITSKELAASIQPFAAFKQSEGYSVAVVDVEDIYDEFSYGVHSPYAVKDFLNWTYLHWQKQPQYVLLGGSGSLDPKNYTGLGNTDLVPVKLIDTSSMETASDDWFVDFDNDGMPQMLIGRLPVRNAADASDLVSKIISYEQSGKANSAVLVSDISDDVDFNTPNAQLRSLIPLQMNVVSIVRGQTNTDARTELLDQLSQGGKIINYEGHGSVNLWRGNLLTSNDAQALTNQKPSPLLVTMTCLNAYFMDPRAASLGEALIRVHQGGPVSVWASSGMTDTGNQAVMNQTFFLQLFSNTNITLGQAIRAAKVAEQDNDVRRTWILFGDPSMTIKQ